MISAHSAVTADPVGRVTVTSSPGPIENGGVSALPALSRQTASVRNDNRSNRSLLTANRSSTKGIVGSPSSG